MNRPAPVFFPPPPFLLDPRRTTVVALGSNLGDRLDFLNRAVDALAARGLRILRRSRLYRTRPLPGSGGGPFLNAALALQYDLRPSRLLQITQAVERDLGRAGPDRRQRWAARTLDLDIIFCGRDRIDRSGLRVPHPAWRERDFVIAGLLDLGAIPPDCSAAQARSRLFREFRSAESSIESVHAWPLRWTPFA